MGNIVKTVEGKTIMITVSDGIQIIQGPSLGQNPNQPFLYSHYDLCLNI